MTSWPGTEIVWDATVCPSTLIRHESRDPGGTPTAPAWSFGAGG